MSELSSLATLFGYPVEISGLQHGHVLYFNGQKWRNVGIDAMKTYVGLTSPDTEDNKQLAVFTLDGLPVMPGDAMQTELPLTLVLECVRTGPLDSKVHTRMIPHPWGRLASLDYFAPTIVVTVQDEPEAQVATAGVPLTDVSIV